MSNPSASLLLAGCGNMGGSMLSKWLELPELGYDFYVIDPAAKADMSGAKLYASLDELSEVFQPDMVLFGVKPQILEQILPAYAQRFKDASPLYMSMAAGKTIDFYQQYLGTDAAFVRLMPNTPCMVGQGVIGMMASKQVSSVQKEAVERLMTPFGYRFWVEQETELDYVTAISGSGPAYVFYFMECLETAAKDLGLAPEVAHQLALHTVAGSAVLAGEKKQSFAELRKQVTSPGGTTAAALDILMADKGLDALVKAAIYKAYARSRELM